MKTKLVHISIKMIIAGIVTLFLAYFLNVRYYTTASAIAILSIQWTKRDFINIAIKRLISGVAAILLATLMFTYIGHSFLVFSCFLIIFISASWFLNAPEGIVPSVVIVTHLLSIDMITFAFVLEETLLLVIAIGVAFIVNMIYPQSSVQSMKKSLRDVDSILEEKLLKIKNKLLNTEKTELKINSKKELGKIMSEVHMIDRDIILQNDHRYITYLYMRNMQISVLDAIDKNVDSIKENHPYRFVIADFIDKVGKSIGFNNYASKLIVELEELKEYFVKSELPKTRIEFETRAVLFQIINELETFLSLKIEFHNKYPNFIEKENLQ
ncbi:aromatic acid exporter family protein [Haploplasma axanthum]|nr:aromatic acid exporter family protein [Haploplasma axanthum]